MSRLFQAFSFDNATSLTAAMAQVRQQAQEMLPSGARYRLLMDFEGWDGRIGLEHEPKAEWDDAQGWKHDYARGVLSWECVVPNTESEGRG